MSQPTPSGASTRTSTRVALPLLLGALLMFALAACGAAGSGGGNGDGDGNGNGDPTELKPSVNQVLALDNTFDFEYMPDVTIDDLEWDVEVEYRTSDYQAVFDHYETVFTGLGFERTEFDSDGSEIEADYRHPSTGVEIEIEVERDDGRVDVDLDIEDPSTYTSGEMPGGFSLTNFMGMEIPFYDESLIRDLEWDFNFDHPDSTPVEVWEYYDALLQDLGWRQIELDDDDDDEWEAEYVRDGVALELEVEDEDDGITEVEIEFNKLRFYQAR